MTAEIAILNKEAVALATDSAVTINQGNKIYNSANKLFTLSKFHPVGIMIYGGATFMQIPWETIIKLFRCKLHDKKYKKLADYANQFIRFLQKNEPNVTKEMQHVYVFVTLHGIYETVLNAITKSRNEFLKTHKIIELKDIRKIVSDEIYSLHTNWKKRKNIPKLPKQYKSRLYQEFKEELTNAKRNVFENLPVDKKSESKLKDLLYYALTKEIWPLSGSGIVIAGFGEGDLFPALVSYDIQSFVLGKLKYKTSQISKINSKNSGLIAPFAQNEMVFSFMDGIEKKYRSQLEQSINDLFLEFGELVINNINSVKPLGKTKTQLLSQTKDVAKKISDGLKIGMKTYSEEYHSGPIMNSVSTLPKDELANMAEALVNLTSFKRRVAFDQKETVGGPIDVAVISKGDGFIWIKRKHYFKLEYNQHFMRTYFNDKNNKVCKDE